jgi:CheY-like chemotaxis protein
MKKVLIFDDNPDILQLLQLILEDAGYDVKGVGNGYECLDVVKDYTPDLVLMDVMLGELDGMVLCDQLKSDPQANEIPVIIISASHGIRDMEIRQCRADGFIQKPFEIDSFVTMIDRVVGM